MRILVPIFCLLFVVACSEPPVPQSDAVPRVKTVLIGETAQGQVRRISGKLIAADSSTLSFAVAGTVDQVNVSAGQPVSKGQVLASLQKRSFELDVQNGRAELNIARAQLNERSRRFQRIQELFEESIVSRAELDVAEAELRTAEGNLETAQSSLENAERDLMKTTLVAPFAGKLAERNIDPFQEVSIGMQAFVLESSDALQVEVLVPETMIRDVDHSQVVQVEFPTLDEVRVAGEVVEIGSQVQAGNAFPVKVQLAPTQADLRPGMSAAVVFNFRDYLDNQTVFMVPLSAVAIESGLLANYGKPRQQGRQRDIPLYIFDEASSSVQFRQVKGGDLRGNLLEVFSGLQAGDRVVTAGVSFLQDGMEVRLWDVDQGLVE